MEWSDTSGTPLTNSRFHRFVAWYLQWSNPIDFEHVQLELFCLIRTIRTATWVTYLFFYYRTGFKMRGARSKDIADFWFQLKKFDLFGQKPTFPTRLQPMVRGLVTSNFNHFTDREKDADPKPSNPRKIPKDHQNSWHHSFKRAQILIDKP